MQVRPLLALDMHSDRRSQSQGIHPASLELHRRPLHVQVVMVDEPH